MEFRDKKHVALFQGSDMSAGGHSRNSTLGIDCYRIVTRITYVSSNV